jgi:protein tyrosine phosphatase (PTP) superfamily phosphohydrolase (DUF442 family)
VLSRAFARVDRSEAEPDHRPRWRRRGVRAVLLYVGLVVVIHALVWTGVLVARIVGNNPTKAMHDVPNFRVVDELVWAGGQPDAQAYRALAEGGVRLVVDLRTGAADDPRKDDPGFLNSLGIAYVSLPVADGHVPSTDQVGRFTTLAKSTPGRVYVHCGGGVGRTSALTAAYARRSGADAPITDLVAIGPHTLEQLWFVATGDRNVVVRRASEIVDAPRRAWSRFRGLLRTAG